MCSRGRHGCSPPDTRSGPPARRARSAGEAPVTKHIFVTGGVASSLGKGLTRLLAGSAAQGRGLRVTMQKLDPYINVDPGTMNPFEHGEVFVTDDGGETDLDLGHYERFIDEHLSAATPTPPPGRSTRRSSPPSAAATTSGKTVQVIPHITDEIKRRITRPGHRRRRRGHHRDRRHRRRHRDPPVPRGHPAVPPRRRPRQRLLRPRHAGARSSARRASRRPSPPSTRSPSCAAGASSPTPSCAAASRAISDGAEAQDLHPVRRARRAPWSTPPTPATSTRSRSSSTTRASTTVVCELLRLRATATPTCASGRSSSTGSRRPTTPVRIGIIGKYVQLPDAYLSVVEALKHGGFHHGAKVEIEWIQAEDVEGLLAERPPARPRRHRHPRRVRRARHRGQDRRRRLRPRARASPASGCASGCR